MSSQRQHNIELRYSPHFSGAPKWVASLYVPEAKQMYNSAGATPMAAVAELHWYLRGHLTKGDFVGLQLSASLLAFIEAGKPKPKEKK